MIKRLFKRPKAEREAKIILSNSGFILENKSVRLSVAFDDVIEITAFKRDLLTTDLVCFGIKLSHQGKITDLEVNEEMLGFDILVERLTILPGFVSDWRQHVIKPAFAEQKTVVFERPKPE